MKQIMVDVVKFVTRERINMNAPVKLGLYRLTKIKHFVKKVS